MLKSLIQVTERSDECIDFKAPAVHCTVVTDCF